LLRVCFIEEHLIYWKTLCHQVAVAIQNARLFEEVHSSHQSLKALSRRLVDVQENERRAVGRELHDEIGQSLTGLRLLLESQKRLPTDGAGPQLDSAIVLINELIGQVRSLSMRLRPAMLDDLGLVPTLLWHFERYSAQTQIQVQFEHAGLEQRFASEIETAVYRITQEALTNVARHAGIDNVSVRIWTTLRTIYVQISDEGTGFDPGKVATDGRSNGLIGMRERVLLLNGRLQIDTAPGAGTCLTAELPLDSLDTGNVD
jgi:signal transduction histidine kinase